MTELANWVASGMPGNYNALTARVYEDFGLFTADEEIADDVADLFNHLTGFGRPAHFRKLLVAPFTLRPRLVDESRIEIRISDQEVTVAQLARSLSLHEVSGVGIRREHGKQRIGADATRG